MRTRSAPRAARSPSGERGIKGFPRRHGWVGRRRCTVLRCEGRAQRNREPRGNESLLGQGLWNSRTKKRSPSTLGVHFPLGGRGCERQKGCSRQHTAQTGRKLEHPLKALCSSPNSTGTRGSWRRGRRRTGRKGRCGGLGAEGWIPGHE